MKSEIHYRAGYKYQLAEDYEVAVQVFSKTYLSKYLDINATGRLAIAKGYAWDGPSGPSVDSKNFMRGSLVHDALYQLMREGQIPQTVRVYADELLRTMCREDGMSWFRAWYVYRACRWFAGKASKPKAVRPVLRAPG